VACRSADGAVRDALREEAPPSASEVISDGEGRNEGKEADQHGAEDERIANRTRACENEWRCGPLLPTRLIFSAKFGARIVKIDGSAIAVASL
jgi:hypothetical protein